MTHQEHHRKEGRDGTHVDIDMTFHDPNPPVGPLRLDEVYYSIHLIPDEHGNLEIQTTGLGPADWKQFVTQAIEQLHHLAHTIDDDFCPFAHIDSVRQIEALPAVMQTGDDGTARVVLSPETITAAALLLRPDKLADEISDTIGRIIREAESEGGA